MLDTGESENEKDDVAIITLDQSNGDLETPSEKPRADECKTVDLVAIICYLLIYLIVEVMKEAVLPPLLEQPRILSDTINTWEIKDWRKLPRRTRGPVFEAGGFPWLVELYMYTRF
jgi:ubiquitin carboxyl-terminal hydrolase 7